MHSYELRLRFFGPPFIFNNHARQSPTFLYLHRLLLYQPTGTSNIIFGSIYSQAVDILSVLPFSFYHEVSLYENVLIAANTIVLRNS